MTMTGDTTASSEWRAHWKVVLSATGGISLASISIYSLGTFIAPLQQEFGWSRTAITTGLMIQSLTGALLVPFVGAVVDRIGPRRIGIFGAIAFCCAVAALSFAGPEIWTWWALWVGVALTGPIVSAPVWTSAVSSFFVKNRGTALAVCLSGTSIAAAIVPIFATTLIHEYGWRVAYRGVAGLWFVAVVPALVLCFTSARDRGRTTQQAAQHAADSETGTTMREGLFSMQFAKIFLGTLIISLAIMANVVNLVPILKANGLTGETAAMIAGLIGVGGITGKLTIGYFLDRFDCTVVTAVGILIPAIYSALLLSCPQSVTASAIAVFALGLSLGAMLQAPAFLTARFFGLRSFGFLLA